MATFWPYPSPAAADPSALSPLAAAEHLRLEVQAQLIARRVLELVEQRIADDGPQCISIAEAAALLGISESKARDMAQARQLPVVTGCGDRLLIHRPTLVQWIRRHVEFGDAGGRALRGGDVP